MRYMRPLAAALVASTLNACAYFDRLAEVGKPPSLSAIENPVMQPGYRPVSMPMPAPEPEPARFNPNSLWRNGARAFFKDQRAARVGDILTVIVEITDQAKMDNASKRSLDASEGMGVNSFFGLEKAVAKILPDGTDLSSAVDLSSGSKTDGSGTIQRAETVTTKIAAVVTQVLPNGNMVVEGRQEVRLNYEMRELVVAGVVRPEDITSDNTIPISKIAEARVSYGGRGMISDVQQPRYGQQVMDILLPW